MTQPRWHLPPPQKPGSKLPSSPQPQFPRRIDAVRRRETSAPRPYKSICRPLRTGSVADGKSQISSGNANYSEKIGRTFVGVVLVVWKSPSASVRRAFTLFERKNRPPLATQCDPSQARVGAGWPVRPDAFVMQF